MALRTLQDSQYKDNELWEWSVWLDGTPEELEQIDYVEYNLGASFRPPKRTVQKRSSKFRLQATAGGPFTIYVRAVLKKNKPPVLLEHYLDLLYPDGTPRRDQTLTSLDRVEKTFDNGNKAQLVIAPANARGDEIVQVLRIPQPASVILISGGGDGLNSELAPRLSQLCSRVIARAALAADALIIDGGTKSGVMELMGQAIADSGYKTMLLGIAPASQVVYPGQSIDDNKAPLDPNHSHFVLVDCPYWGCEVETRNALTHQLAAQGAHVVNIVINGGAITAQEVVWTVRHKYPIIIIQGSGRLADDIADAWSHRPISPHDPLMAEIIADGKIELYPLENSVKGLERLIVRKLGTDQVLYQAWEQFADYDLNAILQQRRFDLMQGGVLAIGLVATALALIQKVGNPTGTVQRGNIWWFSYYVLLLLPITLTILITAANRFRQGNKWLLLRASAEAIKREIYRYRVRAGDYEEILVPPSDASAAAGSTVASPPPTPEQVLAQRVEDITRRAMRTEVNTSSLVPYSKEKGFPPHMYGADTGDDGFSPLTPDSYVEVRLKDQLAYYKKKAVRLERTLKLIQWSIFIIGGLGTFLAAINQQVWIALTTAAVAALSGYLGYKQTEITLMKYNQAATDLANCKAWWLALPVDEQAQQQNINALVNHTEKVLLSELDGWVQQMQDALAELRKGQEKAPPREEPPAKPD